MFAFNLVEEPFIPVLTSDGRSVELGVRETLFRSHEIREVRGTSPLATIALQRLLLAILHRNFGPANVPEWEKLWVAGRWGAGVLEAYLVKWRDRFDLFHPEYPFYQTAGFRTKEPSSTSRLAHEQASGNNATLFDHTRDEASQPLTPARAARLVIAQQAYAIGGGKSATGYTSHAPLLQGVVIFPQGATLFETLMLNLIEYNARKPFPARDDAPVWERDAPPRADNTIPNGYLDYLTWQSRALALHAATEDGRTVVRGVSYAQGRKLEAPGLFDPMMAYRKDEKKGWLALRLSENRELWRDSAALFQVATRDPGKRPECFDWLQACVEEGVLRCRQRYDFSAFGLCTDQAKVHFWRHDRLPLPLAYLDDVDLLRNLGEALDVAEKGAIVLRGSVRHLAGSFLAPGGNPDRDRVQKVVESLAPEWLYWSALEVPFRRLMVRLADEAGDTDRLQRAVANWACETVAPRVNESFEQMAGRLDQSARLLRAVALARQKLAADLGQLAGPYREVLNAQSA
jgi:CRISPR system Cascade subunit CasA